MSARINTVVLTLVTVLVIFAMSMFTVDQRQFAIVFQLGEVKRVIEEPGLYFKIPMIQNVRFLAKRILSLDSNELERFITSEKKNLLVDSYVKWRIVDPKLYYISLGGDEARAKTRLNQTINAGLREEIGRRTVHQVISSGRDGIMGLVSERADVDARRICVQIVDVRLKRIELASDVSEAVYRRMEAERKRVANELRSQGYAESEQIRADADRQREIIVANAYRDAQKTKGEGDAKATAIYGQAFSESPEFYSFYRSLEAYRGSFKSKNDVLVLEPSSEFFKYMKGAGRGNDKGK